jgi:thiamine biosynthesis protein ThiC
MGSTSTVPVGTVCLYNEKNVITTIIERVFVAVFPKQTQNLMAIHCSFNLDIVNFRGK